MNKLLADTPETLEGIAGSLYPAFLREAQESELFQSPRTRLPLLSYGEITDMSGREPVAQPALAMPTGQSGHALRIVRAQIEDWGWYVDGNATMKLTNIDPEDEGHWCDNALSINQIKFTSGSSYYVHGSNNSIKRPLRWVLVQTAAETIIFQPTLHGVPVQKKPCSCGNVVRGLRYITTDAIIRIPIKETGGRAHCDVAFNPATETKPPQIAIIDEGGQWTVWNITGSRHVRKTVLLPFLHAKGTFTNGISSGPSVIAHDLGHLHRILWLPKTAEDAPQSNTILICNATSVSVTDVGTVDRPLRTFDLVHSIGVDIVVDVQVSPVNTSYVFVLTTTSIFWLDLSPLQAARSPGASSKASKTNQPFLLLSCPHLRGPGDKTMKLSLASAKSDHGDDVAVALVYSMRHPEVAVFWFQQATDGGQATYQQQVFQLAHPQFGAHGRKLKSHLFGQQTMVLLPKEVRIRMTYPRHNGTLGLEYAQKGVSVLQVLTLGADLSLWSSLCVSSSGPVPIKLAPFPPTLKRRHPERQGKVEKRKKAGVRHLRNCFVVSDDFEEHLLNASPPSSTHDQRVLATGSAAHNDSRSARPVEVYNMARLFNLLSKQMDKAAKSAYEATDMVRGFQNPSPLDVIRQILDIATEHGSFAYTTLYAPFPVKFQSFSFLFFRRRQTNI
jgi:RNA polymerase I-specific transcription initiation factor RRN6